MRIFNLLLFITPTVCLLRIHWITFLMIGMLLSLFETIKEIFNNRKKDQDRAHIFHPMSKNMAVLISLLLFYQLVSLIYIYLNPQLDIQNLIDSIKKMIFLWMHIPIAISLLYIVENYKKRDEFELSFKALENGIMLAAGIFLFDHIINHALFRLIIPKFALEGELSYKISQSHMGQVLCTVIVWPLIANLLINNKKGRAILLGALVFLISITPFVFHKLNYNAWLSFFAGLVCFMVFCSKKKWLVPASIIGFIALTLIVPISFIALDNDKIVNSPNIKDSITHRICIWEYYAQKTKDHTVLGIGFNSAEIFNKVEKVTCNMVMPFKQMPMLNEFVANGYHPHNIGLQLLMELGMFGLAIVILIGAGIIVAINKEHSHISRKYTVAIITKNSFLKASAMASFFAFLLFLIAAVNIWAIWVMLTIAFACALNRMLVLKNNYND